VGRCWEVRDFFSPSRYRSAISCSSFCTKVTPRRLKAQCLLNFFPLRGFLASYVRSQRAAWILICRRISSPRSVRFEKRTGTNPRRTTAPSIPANPGSTNRPRRSRSLRACHLERCLAPKPGASRKVPGTQAWHPSLADGGAQARPVGGEGNQVSGVYFIHGCGHDPVIGPVGE